MKAKDALIGWTPDMTGFYDNPTAGQVLVAPLPGPGEPDPICPFARAGGAAVEARRTMAGWKQIAMVFIDFHAMVTRDCIDPEEAHQAMLEIDEFRRWMAPDIEGSDGRPMAAEARGGGELHPLWFDCADTVLWLGRRGEVEP